MIRKLARKRIKLIPGRNEGQSMVLVAICVPVIFVVLAFAVDGAHAFVDYRHLQNAADASSLAAAQDINSTTCTNPHCVQDAVTDYAFQNGEWPVSSTAGTGLEIQPCAGGDPSPPHGPNPGDVAACFDWPYNGDPTRVLVKMRDCTATFIGGFLSAVGLPPDIKKICYSVRSVAISNPQVTTSVTTYPDIPPTEYYNTITSTTVINGTPSVFTTTTPVLVHGTTQTITSTTPTNAVGSTVVGNTVTNTITSTTAGSLTNQALFAYAHNGQDTCSSTAGIVIGGGNGQGQGSGNISGAVSNGSISDTSNNTFIQEAQYLAAAGSPQSSCAATGAKVVSSSSYSTPRDWPLKWTMSQVCGPGPPTAPSTTTDPAPGYYNRDITLDKTYTPGVYCSTGTITFGGTGTTFNVTAVADQLLIAKSTNNLKWCPYLDSTPPYCPTSASSPNGQNLVLWQTGTQDLTFNSQNTEVDGVMWVTNANLVYAANSGGFGFWEAQNIFFTGNAYQMVGTGPPITGPPGTTTITQTIPGSTTVPVTIPTSIVGTTTVSTPDSTSNSVSTGTTTGPDTTTSSVSTQTIPVPGTTGGTTTTVKTTGTNLALNQ
jgi:hypothetical protein